jgi:zinc D-Ala-D-Ala carboxypeptidase
VEPEHHRSQPPAANPRPDLSHRPGGAPSRRELHRAPTGRRGGTHGSVASRWVPRGAILVALAVATVVVPVLDVTRPTATSSPEVPVVASAGGLSAQDVLSGTVPQSTPTSLLAAGRSAREVTVSVSRSIERDPLPGCDGKARPASSNGQIPSSDLCYLWDPNHALRGDAAVAISELNLAYRASFGRDLCLTDSYRPLSVQRRLAVTKPGLAAAPGRSNHGWGLAVDLCNVETDNPAAFAWLRENGPTYGWDNPQWARRGGVGPYEPWHWEYLPGTSGLGTNWDER